MSTLTGIPKVITEYWGLIPYAAAWQRQQDIHAKMMETKLRYREDPEMLMQHQVHRLIFCQHPHVYTLGKSGSPDHLKLDENALHNIGAEYFRINRGGDITYHGPGQVVGYLLFDLDCFKSDVHWFVRSIEEGIIRFLAEQGVTGLRLKQYTGVWVEKPGGGYAKLCAIGVHLSRWISMHGFAFNIAPELPYFDHIIPCGITDNDKEVTSLNLLTGREYNLGQVESRLATIYAEVFGY